MRDDKEDIHIESWEGFHFFKTADGSPTMSMGSLEAEKMHHMGGAFSETLFVYQDVVDVVLEQDWERRFFNLGLGLGYIELLVASKVPEIGLMCSFESHPDLQRHFLNWVEGKLDAVPQAFRDTYEEILRRYSIQFQTKKSDILWNLKKWKNEKSWRVFGRFQSSESPCDSMTGLFFDPFSNKTNEELWREEDLNSVLSNVAGDNAVFATYASTGALKRALKKQGFSLEPKKGFQGKRESTLAIRARGKNELFAEFLRTSR